MKTQQVALFTFTQPELMDGISTVAKKNGQTVGGAVQNAEVGKDSVSLTLQLESRKNVASRLGVKMNKDNASVIDTEVLRMKDALKKAAFGEFAKLATDPNWTGGTFRLAQAKNGQQRATMSLVSVSRATGKLTDEVLIKALSMMTEEEQMALMQRAEAAARLLKAPIELAQAAETVEAAE